MTVKAVKGKGKVVIRQQKKMTRKPVSPAKTRHGKPQRRQ